MLKRTGELLPNTAPTSPAAVLRQAAWNRKIAELVTAAKDDA